MYLKLTGDPKHILKNTSIKKKIFQRNMKT